MTPTRALGMDGRAVRLCALAIACASLVALLSCEDDENCVYPNFQVGAVEGYVLVAGEGRSVLVGARTQEGLSRGEVVARVQSDSTGWYRFELPTGLYRIETDPSAGIVHTSRLTDTITVTPSVQRFDLLRGSLTLLIHMPPDLEGERYRALIRSSYFPSPSSEVLQVEDGTLRFEYSVLPLGGYRASLDVWSGSARIYLPAAHDEDEAEIIEVGADEPVTYEASFVESFASIMGSVTGSWQEGSDYFPFVEAFSSPSTTIAGISCEDDGTFYIPLLAAVPVRLSTSIHGIEQWVGGASYEEARLFNLQAGDRVTGVDIRESGIEVTLQGPGAPAHYRPTMRLLDAAGNRKEIWDQSNRLTICNLAPGEYRLLVYGYCDGQTWASQWYDGAETLGEATPIVLGEGELKRISMSLVEGGRIAGRILTSGGAVLDDFLLRIVDAEGNPLCGEWEVFTGGQFSYTGLADGAYHLAVRPPGSYEPWWYPGTHEFESATPIEIRDHEAVTGVEWSLP